MEFIGKKGLVYDFFEHLANFPFYKKLNDCFFEKHKITLGQVLSEKRYIEVIDLLLSKNGLNFAQLPKGLLPFHIYDQDVATPVEEHLLEALEYLPTLNQSTVHIHFTVSSNHIQLFADHIQSSIVKLNHPTDISFSYSTQNSATDTLVMTDEEQLLRDENEALIFRPAGHGALLENLNSLDFEGWRKREKDYRSTTRDVKALITELTTQGIDGLMIDLRYNGGGSLQEAIEMTGLFVPEGPIVQVRDTRKQVDVYKDEDKGKTFYDGPLAVLTNRASASASEIFSGAIQDYKRGVIVGESTYGKGTVQNIIELKKFVNHPSWKLGQVKMTIAKFYRVTGSSNQRVGIIPDVQFPSIYSLEEYGEGSRPNALPWDEIKNANFHTTNHISEELIEQLNVLYRKDLNTEGDLKKLLKKIEERKLEREKTTISLNLEARKNIQEEKKSNNDDEGEMTAKVDEEVSEEDKRQKELEKDPYLKEGLRLLAEVVKKKIG